MEPAGDTYQVAESFKERIDFGVEKSVVRMADVAPKPSITGQLFFYGCAIVGDHATEPGSGAAVTYDGAKEVYVLTNRLKGRRGIKKHESKLEPYPDFFQDFNGADVLLDGAALVQCC